MVGITWLDRKWIPAEESADEGVPFPVISGYIPPSQGTLLEKSSRGKVCSTGPQLRNIFEERLKFFMKNTKGFRNTAQGWILYLALYNDLCSTALAMKI